MPETDSGLTELLRHDEYGDAMGATFSIVLYGHDRAEMEVAINAAFAEVGRLDAMLSNYRPESELSEVNRRAAKEPAKISPELFELLSSCLAYSRESEGAFDIAVGPLMKLWGFYKGSGRLPSPSQVAAVLPKLGYRNVHLDAESHTVRFGRSGVELDPGGIGKGYAVDRTEAVLIIELDGLKDGMERLADRIIKICRANRVREVKIRQGCSGARHSLGRSPWSVRRSFQTKTELHGMRRDRSPDKLPQVLGEVREISRKYNLPIANVFHAGDGNLHPIILFDIRDEEETLRVKTAGTEILRSCVDAGGTISGEHGIGFEKLGEMSFIFSQDDIAAMWKLKNAFDPAGQLNPGKVLPPISS